MQVQPVSQSNQECLLQEVSPAELRAIEGGSIFSRIYNWVRNHISVSGKDMGGNSAGVVSVKGKWSGNP